MLCAASQLQCASLDTSITVHPNSKLNAPADLPNGTVIVKDPLKCDANVTWPTYLLNEAHMQIQFILKDSGFFGCRSTSSNGIYTTIEKFILLCFTHMYHSSLVTLRATTTVFVVTELHAFQRHSNFVVSANAPQTWLVTQNPSFPIIFQIVSMNLSGWPRSISSKCCRRTILKMVLQRFNLVCTIGAASLVPVQAKCFTWSPLVGSSTAAWKPFQLKLVPNRWLWSNTTCYVPILASDCQDRVTATSHK